MADQPTVSISAADLAKLIHNTPTTMATPMMKVAPPRVNEGSEALLGAANGVVAGGLTSMTGSVAYTYLKDIAKGTHSGNVLKNIGSAHLAPVIGGTLAVGLVNGLVRHGSAVHHNQWADAVGQKIERQEAEHKQKAAEAKFAEKEETRQASAPNTPVR